MNSNISARPIFCSTSIYKGCMYDRENTVIEFSATELWPYTEQPQRKIYWWHGKHQQQTTLVIFASSLPSSYHHGYHSLAMNHGWHLATGQLWCKIIHSITTTGNNAAIKHVIYCGFIWNHNISAYHNSVLYQRRPLKISSHFLC